MNAIDLASFAGLTALVLLTVNILLGLLVSTNYNPARDWPRRKLPWPLFRIHNWTGYTAMCVACLHPVILLFVDSKVARFGLRDVLLPLWSQGQTLYNCLGAIAFWGFALVVTTSYLRPKLGYRPWKKLHYTAYAAALAMFVHGSLIDQNLKNAGPDLLDGEKVLIEGCLLAVAAASVWRWKRGSEKQRHRTAKVARTAVLCAAFTLVCHAQTWTSIGPAPLTGGNGPTGRIRSIAVDPSDPAHWLLGAAGGGVWESRDSGASWNPIADSQPNLNIGSVTFATSNPKVMYAGTGEATWGLMAHPGSGILKSTDGGASWSLLSTSTFSRASVGAIRVDPANPNVVLAVMSRGYSGRLNEQATGPATLGLKRSTDGGVTWTLKLVGESTALDVDPSNFSRQYAGMGVPAGFGTFATPVPSGLYRSLDAGQNWAIVAGPWSGSNVGRFAVAIAPGNSNTIYVSVQGGADVGGRLLGLYRTDNAWDPAPAWIRIPTSGNFSTPGCVGCTDYCGTRCTELTTLSVDPSDAGTLFAGGISLWRCDHCDLTASWTDVGVDSQGRAVLPQAKRCLAWAGDRLLTGTDAGLFSTTTRGASWQDNNAGLGVARFLAGDLHPTDANRALGGVVDSAAALWTGSDSWQVLPSGQGAVAFSSSSPDRNWMAASTSRVFRTLDGGRTLGAADGGVVFTGAAPVLPVTKCPASDDVFVTGTNRLFRTENFFQPGSPLWAANSPVGSAVSTIAFPSSPADCQTYAYGTMAGEIRITRDGGNSWIDPDSRTTLPACGTGPGYCARAVSSIAFDPAAPKTMYVALSGFDDNAAKPGHLFKTLDWTAAAPVWINVSPPVNMPANVVALDPATPDSVYVGTDAAVWHSRDGGKGWRFLGPNTGLPNVPVFDLKINSDTNRIVAFTFGRGAFALDVNTPPASGFLEISGVPPSANAALGSPLSQQLAAGVNPPYAWSIAGGFLPPGIVLLPSGEIAGTPLSPGVFNFIIQVSDGSSTASQAYTLTVDTPGTAPVWAAIGPSPLNGNMSTPSRPPQFISGRVATIATDPGDNTHWLVGFGNSGLWETRDSGTSFRPIADTAPTLVIGAVAFAPSDPRIIYAATGETTGPGFTKAGVGMLKSADAGKTWALLAESTFARAAVRRVRVHPANADIVLAATSRGGFGRDSLEGVPGSPPFGIWKSTNGGTTWARTLAGSASALEADPRNFSNLYAAVAEQRLPTGINNDAVGNSVNGLYRSTDSGQTWSLIPGPWGDSTATRAAMGRIELAIAPSNPNILYASMAAAPNGGSNGLSLLGLYRTDNAWDSKATWIQIPIGAIGPDGYCGPTKCNYSHVISVDPSNPNTLFAGGAEEGFWRCTNCGSSPVWTNLTANTGVHPDYHALAWAGNRLIAGNDGGVWSTGDLGSSWQNHNATFPNLMFFGADLHPTDPEFIFAGLRDNGSVTGRGEFWTGATGRYVDVPEVGEAEVAISSSHPDTHWMAAWIWGAIGRTTDAGQSWFSADTGIDKSASVFVAPVRKCPTNDEMFLTGTNRIWRTDNFFNSTKPLWVANSPEGLPNRLGPATILSIAYSPSDKTCNTYAYGTLGGEVRLTRNGGRTWTDLDPASNLPARGVNGLAFDPADANILYAAISSFDNATPGKPGHVFKTINALANIPSWRNVSPPQDQPFNVIAVDPVNPKIVYAGSDVGLWRSTDSAATWIRQGASVGMPIAPVYDIKINPATGRTAVFTYGRSAFALGPELVSVTPSPDNCATFAAGPLVPGACAQVQGAQLSGVTASSQDGVEVKVNGIPAIVYSVSPARITFQVPADVTGPVNVRVFRDGVPSNILNVPVAAAIAAPSHPIQPALAKSRRRFWQRLLP